MNRENKLFTRVLLSSFMIPLALGIGSSAAYADLVYSQDFEQFENYCPGDPQYDDWLSFRASLPTSYVQSITVSGSQDPVGRTCSDPTIAQQIADAMRDRIPLVLDCDGNTWRVGINCQSILCGEPDNDLVLSAGGNICSCPSSSESYIVRPGIGNSNWGGIAGDTCGGSTQTMTVIVEIAIEVAIDIKFCSDPNAFNCKKNGVLPVTIFGTEDFMVEDIDPNTLQLCNSDLSVCTEAPRDASYADRGNPTTDLGAPMCAINPDTGEEEDFLNEDTYLDLDAAFEASEVKAILGDYCDEAAKGDVSEALVIIGETYDGVPIYSVPADDNTGIDRLVKTN